MHRRHFVSGSLVLASGIALPRWARAQVATPAASMSSDLPELKINLTDTTLEIQDPISAGRYALTVTNSGTSTDSHYALGKLPDDFTKEDLDAAVAAQDDDAMPWDTIGFVGAADWPQPGGPVKTGVVDLFPGLYFMFDPFDARGYRTVTVEGEFTKPAEEPPADVMVTLKEMEIVLPDNALTTAPVRWRIENTGAMAHEVAVLPISEEITADIFMQMLQLPEDATPPAGMPDFNYLPAAAIGILGAGHTSWLDVQLAPGHYMAACMLPFGTGYPHAMDGMFRIFDLK